jgi:hypothetical protein
VNVLLPHTVRIAYVVALVCGSAREAEANVYVQVWVFECVARDDED